MFLTKPENDEPSVGRQMNRNRWKAAAYAWQNLDAGVRKNWLAAADAAGLRISGYNLWIYYYLTYDRPVIRTIEAQTQLDLLSTVYP